MIIDFQAVRTSVAQLSVGFCFGVVFSGVSLAGDEGHWAFEAVVKPEVPAVRNVDWIREGLDAFVLANLEGEGMEVSGEATRRQLIKRVTYDLTGLVARYEDVEAFANDESGDAYGKLVERLLDSPRYGERWGRHWLDVARYADTTGYLAGGVDRRFPFSYTYRDWVIRAFNEDLPYDRFLKYQIAGDRLVESGDDRRHLAALGFLTLGRRFLNNPHDIIDDRIDVVMRGAQGLTVACARCHDHKTDPIPQQDYYSLYGVFASSEEPAEKPEIGGDVDGVAGEDFRVQLAKVEGEVEAFLQGRADESRSEAKLEAYLNAAVEAWGGDVRRVANERKLYRGLVERWVRFLGGEQGGRYFGVWRELRPVEAGDFAAKSKEVLGRDEGLRGLLGISAADDMGALNSAYAKAMTVALGGAGGELRDVLVRGAPTAVTTDEIKHLLHRGDRDAYRRELNKISKLVANHPGSPPRAMVMVDRGQARNVPVFLRGNPGSHGQEAPRRYLEVLSGDERPVFSDGSGRREMVEAIVDPKNPLTARVMVNRVWGWHFGRPLVDTPSDFGVQCPEPLQRGLLDFLAAEFVEGGWSLKKLHRTILLSATYRQSSDLRADYLERDPENRFLWRMERRRKEFEGLRDGMLQVSGRLDLKMGGQPVDLGKAEGARRRSVYAFIDRQNLPAMFRTFDFANPDSHNPGRFETTVPQQALYLMNNPFVYSQAEALAAVDGFLAVDGAERVKWLYRRVFGREAEGSEVDAALEFVEGGEQIGWMWDYGYGDSATGEFVEYPALAGGAWRGGESLPDGKLGWSFVNERGGHPGRRGFASMRRWTVPADGSYEIRGLLERPAEAGDGVRGRVIVKDVGTVGEWIVAAKGKVESKLGALSLRAGDQVLFSVDCLEDENSDSYLWEISIRRSGEEGLVAHSSRDYRVAEKLDRWEELVQVLLSSNEFAFVD